MPGSGSAKSLAFAVLLAGVATLGISACAPSPEANCRDRLQKADRIAHLIYQRLKAKVPERRPGGSADWAKAMEKIRQARSAEKSENYVECVENLKQSRILLKRASGRY